MEAERDHLSSIISQLQDAPIHDGEADVERLREEIQDLQELLEEERRSNSDLLMEIEQITSAHASNGVPKGDTDLQQENDQLQIALAEAVAERDRLEKRLQAVGVFSAEE